MNDTIRPLPEYRLCENCGNLRPITKYPFIHGNSGPRHHVCRKCHVQQAAGLRTAVDTMTEPLCAAEGDDGQEGDTTVQPAPVRRVPDSIGSTPPEWEQHFCRQMARMEIPPPDSVADLILSWAYQGEIRAAELLLRDWPRVSKWDREDGTLV